jgi:hypothetical protein
MNFTDKLKAGYKKATSKENIEGVKTGLKKFGKQFQNVQRKVLEDDERKGGGLGLF